MQSEGGGGMGEGMRSISYLSQCTYNHIQDNFADQYRAFGVHLENVNTLLTDGSLDVEPDFVANMLSFESKLAHVSMKRAQSREC